MLYAMCGFANFGSLGIMIAGLSTMCPEKRDEVVSLGLKSIVSGTLTTCLLGSDCRGAELAATPPGCEFRAGTRPLRALSRRGIALGYHYAGVSTISRINCALPLSTAPLVQYRVCAFRHQR